MEGDHGWEEAALNTRHMHNRNDRGGRGNTRETFQVRNTFGTHLVKCPALERLQGDGSTRSGASRASSAKAGDKSKQAAFSGKKTKTSRSNSGGGDVVLEIYRLTDSEDGVLGSLKYPGFFEATLVFAGSRKVLGNITRHLGQDGTEDEAPHGRRRASLDSPATSRPGKSLEPQTWNPANGDRDDSGEEEEEEGEDDDDDDNDDEAFSDDERGLSSHENRQRRRLATFEKNSFRQPKFWFRWQGVVSDEALAAAEVDDAELARGRVHGSGYVVFSGNDCRRFQGTMTSEQLQWNNVKMTGWKAKPQPERDFEIQWSHQPVS